MSRGVHYLLQALRDIPNPRRNNTEIALSITLHARICLGIRRKSSGNRTNLLQQLKRGDSSGKYMISLLSWGGVWSLQMTGTWSRTPRSVFCLRTNCGYCFRCWMPSKNRRLLAFFALLSQIFEPPQCVQTKNHYYSRILNHILNSLFKVLKNKLMFRDMKLKVHLVDETWSLKGFHQPFPGPFADKRNSWLDLSVGGSCLDRFAFFEPGIASRTRKFFFFCTGWRLVTKSNKENMLGWKSIGENAPRNARMSSRRRREASSSIISACLPPPCSQVLLSV